MNKTIWLARLLYSHTGGLTRQEIRDKWREQDAVSYTHLTLPTIGG